MSRGPMAVTGDGLMGAPPCGGIMGAGGIAGAEGIAGGGIGGGIAPAGGIGNGGNGGFVTPAASSAATFIGIMGRVGVIGQDEMS